MIKLRREEFPEDITKIQSAVINAGYDCSRLKAAELWRLFSDSMCAGWLMVGGYSEAAIQASLEQYIDPLDE